METQVNVQVANTVIACVRHESLPLLWPEEWTAELEAAGFIDAAAYLLSLMPKQATETPWIIGSATKTLFGTERTDSRAHMEGRAFDMSPMYSDDVAILEDSRIMGLAWNIIYMATFASIQTGKVPFVIEGDHLHVEPGAPGAGLDPGQVFAVFTAPTWYNWTGRILETPIGKALIPSIWLFDGTSCAIQSPSAELAGRLKQYLGA